MKTRKIVAFLMLAPIFLFLQSCLLDNVLAVNPVSNITPVFTVPESQNIVSATNVNVTQPTNTIVSKESNTITCTVKTGIDAGNLNLRTGSGVQYGIITVLKEGEKLEYLRQEENGWKKVKLSDDYTGWVNSNYIDCQQ